MAEKLTFNPIYFAKEFGAHRFFLHLNISHTGALHQRYLTIRLRALNFYEVIVNKGEARVNYRFIEIESE